MPKSKMHVSGLLHTSVQFRCFVGFIVNRLFEKVEYPVILHGRNLKIERLNKTVVVGNLPCDHVINSIVEKREKIK